MLDVAFWLEFRRRADPLIWLALLNPPLLAVHAAFSSSSRPGIEIWLIGLGLTFLACLAGFAAVYAATTVEIRRGVDQAKREKMWLDIIRRGPRSRSAMADREAG